MGGKYMKRSISVFLSLLLALCLISPAMAEVGEKELMADGPEAVYVADEAGLLSPEDESALNDWAREVSEEHGCGVYIITVEDYRDYNGQSVYEAAKTLYTDRDLGLGAASSGVLLLLSMDDRDYYLVAYGDGNRVFTDYGKEELAEEFLDDFADDDWMAGFEDYIDESDWMLYLAAEEEPLDVDGGYDAYAEGYEASFFDRLASMFYLTPLGIVFTLGISALAAWLVCWLVKRPMRSVAARAEAGEYVAPGGVDIRIREDRFTHRTESRRKIERDDSGSGGGTTVDSDGFSGHGGKF